MKPVAEAPATEVEPTQTEAASPPADAVAASAEAPVVDQAAAPAASQVNADENFRAELMEVEAIIAKDDSELQDLNDELDSLKKKIKGKEEEREENVRAMRAIVRGENLTLFDGTAKAAQKKSKKKAEEPSLPVAAEDDSWRKVTLAELGIVKPKTVALMSENDPPLTTMGAIADWTSAGKKLTDIKGIGAAAMQLVDDKMADYWIAHPRQEKAKAEPAPATEAIQTVDQNVIPAAQLGISSDDIEGAYDPTTGVEAKKRNKPRVIVLNLSDSQGRFFDGAYVAVAKTERRPGSSIYKFLPAMDGEAWKATVSKYELKDKTSPPGEFAGEIVRFGAEAAERYLGCDDDAVFLSVGPEIIPVAETGLEAATIESFAHADLLTKDNYGGSGEPTPIRGAATLNGVDYVVTQTTTIMAGSIYALRPLSKPTSETSEPVTDDGFAGRRVRIDNDVYEIGPESSSLLIDVGG